MSDVSKTEGRTVLYVSHNMSTIRELCDRVIVLDHGKVVLDGDVETGIEAYSNAHADSRVFYDLASVEHSPSYKRTLEMRSIAITDQSTNKVVQGKEFGFLLRCKANDSAEKVHLRLETYFGDGSIVGTSFSDRSFSAHRGEILEMRIAMDMKNYVPGRYKCAALLFQLDEHGNQVPLDRVDPAITFEIISEGKGEMVWLHRWWGHIRLNDLHVESISRL